MNLWASLRFLAPTMAAASLAGCGGIIPASDGAGAARYGASSGASSGNSSSQTYTRQPSRAVVAAIPQSVARRGNEANCISDLGSGGARFNALPDTYAAPGCHKLGTVQLMSLAGDRGTFGISNLGPVKCDVASAFSNWARYGVDRAAREILGSRLARIETMGSYVCRNVAGTSKRSAHSRAEAIDVAGFVLVDGRRVSLKQDWNGGTLAEREFLRVVKSSACKRFGTVLSPEYNRAHADHFHLEGSKAAAGDGLCR